MTVLQVQNFDSETLGSSGTDYTNWHKLGNNTSRISIVNDVKRAGTQSVFFDFRYEDWTNDSVGQRLMLSQWYNANVIWLEIGKTYWIGLSTYIDDWDPDAANNGELIWQTHGNTNGPAQSGPPPLALYIHGDRARIATNSSATVSYPEDGRTGPVANYLYECSVANDLQGRWVDWVIQVKHHYTDGLLKVWKNGLKVVDYSGTTIYRWDGQRGDTGTYSPYFNFGIYKWYWGSGGDPTVVSRRSMYVDEVRIADGYSMYSEVAPTQQPYRIERRIRQKRRK